MVTSEDVCWYIPNVQSEKKICVLVLCLFSLIFLLNINILRIIWDGPEKLNLGLLLKALFSGRFKMQVTGYMLQATGQYLKWSAKCPIAKLFLELN